MIVFRCTQRLSRRLKLDFAEDPVSSTGVLGDWYASVLFVGPARLVLCLSGRTRLPVILPARKSEFPARFPEHLSTVLRHIGAPARAIEAELVAAREFAFARTLDRSILGSLNDFAHNARYRLESGDTYLQANLSLTEMPVQPLPETFPDRAARARLSESGLV